MAGSVEEITSSAAKAVGGFREAIQDLLIPEIRSMKATIEALRQEMRLRNERLTQELRLRTENLQEELRQRTDRLQEEMRLRGSTLREEIRARDEKFSESMRNLFEKLDFAIDIRERLVQLEARLPRTQ